MKIALPLVQGKLCMHFGHCEEFSLLDVDFEDKKIISEERITSPPHQPGMLPRWLMERGAEMIVAGGMGARAQNIFASVGIQVVTGAPPVEPKEIIDDLFNGTLSLSENPCGHDHHGCGDH